ncbi:hypothetical protein PRBRB14_19290 [Hallella multisaccharivorax DSM 17128]|uniref:Glycosyl transferase family 2 n=1 Tax=Hallella multisaccharivorax DSM 17128 TaxID=688246 RepID=F8N8U3_9BACT|nr:glycosyltransferase [Hallella multisaccharivorax]EGN57688.1 glycosyl transferase family 2 [Hallella multisaccharivorax DSM 17128]GJG31050.1 hypothetical protein PRBRB14_19290 [Hallella multisaccharivorax DSM 17128]
MKLSIITINFNNKGGLSKTIHSVLEQSFSDFEYIIIDGGSTDGSVELIKKYKDRIDYWVSERDNGIYNAMNKGVRVAKGEYCLFLNSADTLFRANVLAEVFSTNPSADIVCGTICRDGIPDEYVENVSFSNFLTHTIAHQAAFIRTSLLRNNPYDENLKLVSDWKFFFQELILNGVSFQRIHLIISNFDNSGASMSNLSLVKQEHDQELHKMIPSIILDEVYKFFGISDDYYKLFVSIGESPHKWRLYNIIVIILKVLLWNKKWIKEFRLHR